MKKKPLFHDYLTNKKPDRNDSEDSIAGYHSAVIMQMNSIAGQMAVAVPAGNIRISDGFAERDCCGLWIRDKIPKNWWSFLMFTSIVAGKSRLLTQ